MQRQIVCLRLSCLETDFEMENHVHERMSSAKEKIWKDYHVSIHYQCACV